MPTTGRTWALGVVRAATPTQSAWPPFTTIRRVPAVCAMTGCKMAVCCPKQGDTGQLAPHMTLMRPPRTNLRTTKVQKCKSAKVSFVRQTGAFHGPGAPFSSIARVKGRTPPRCSCAHILETWHASHSKSRHEPLGKVLDEALAVILPDAVLLARDTVHLVRVVLEVHVAVTPVCGKQQPASSHQPIITKVEPTERASLHPHPMRGRKGEAGGTPKREKRPTLPGDGWEDRVLRAGWL